jgi:hypothetical protein
LIDRCYGSADSTTEYQRAAAKAAEIFVLSSRSDAVLEFAFPVDEGRVVDIVLEGAELVLLRLSAGKL